MAPKRKNLIPKRSESATSSSSDPATHPRRHQGPKRSYYISTNYTPPHFLQSKLDGKLDWYSVAGLVVLSLSLKLIQLKEINFLVPTEDGVIKALYRYASGHHYNDSIPPLSKLVHYLVALLFGFDGNIGSENNLNLKKAVPLYGLRFFNVLLSSVTVGLFYGILRQCGVELLIANLSSLLLIFENLLVLESRLISEQNLHVLFLALVCWLLVKLQNSQEFSCTWIKSLGLVGLTLGLSFANSWKTINTLVWLIAVFGLKFIENSQDLSITNCFIAKQYLLKAKALFVIPLIVYILIFVAHIELTPNHHLDSSLLSTAFQRSQLDNPLAEIPKYVSFGSTVTIVHSDSLGGYLHSHPYDYRTGSLEQQVTVFDYLEDYNEWVIEPADFVDESEPRIRSGSDVRLRHKSTGKLLSVNPDMKPPISEQEDDFEISCVGNSTTEGSEYEQFKIDFIQGDDDSEWLESTKTKFTIYNSEQGCYVLSHDLKLPEWGFGQQEVLCIKEPNPARHNYYIEQVKYTEKQKADPKLQEFTEVEPYPIWKKIIELNKLIARLSSKLSEITKINSTGLQWIFNKIQYVLFYNDRSRSVFYVIGNWLNFQLVILAVGLSSLFVAKNYLWKPTTNLTLEFNLTKLQTFVLGYIIHLLFNPEDSLLVDYKSSLFLGLLLVGLLSQHYLIRFGKSREKVIYGALALVVLSSYFRYHQVLNLTLGTRWNEEDCEVIAEAGFFSDDGVCELYSS